MRCTTWTGHLVRALDGIMHIGELTCCLADLALGSIQISSGHCWPQGSFRRQSVCLRRVDLDQAVCHHPGKIGIHNLRMRLLLVPIVCQIPLDVAVFRQALPCQEQHFQDMLLGDATFTVFRQPLHDDAYTLLDGRIGLSCPSPAHAGRVLWRVYVSFCFGSFSLTLDGSRDCMIINLTASAHAGHCIFGILR